MSLSKSVIKQLANQAGIIIRKNAVGPNPTLDQLYAFAASLNTMIDVRNHMPPRGKDVLVRLSDGRMIDAKADPAFAEGFKQDFGSSFVAIGGVTHWMGKPGIPAEKPNAKVHVEAAFKSHEACALCKNPTLYWYAPKDVAVCPVCAKTASDEDIPSKRDWLTAQGVTLPSDWQCNTDKKHTQGKK